MRSADDVLFEQGPRHDAGPYGGQGRNRKAPGLFLAYNFALKPELIADLNSPPFFPDLRGAQRRYFIATSILFFIASTVGGLMMQPRIPKCSALLKVSLLVRWETPRLCRGGSRGLTYA